MKKEDFKFLGYSLTNLLNSVKLDVISGKVNKTNSRDQNLVKRYIDQVEIEIDDSKLIVNRSKGTVTLSQTYLPYFTSKIISNFLEKILVEESIKVHEVELILSIFNNQFLKRTQINRITRLFEDRRGNNMTFCSGLLRMLNHFSVHYGKDYDLLSSELWNCISTLINKYEWIDSLFIKDVWTLFIERKYDLANLRVNPKFIDISDDLNLKSLDECEIRFLILSSLFNLSQIEEKYRDYLRELPIIKFILKLDGYFENYKLVPGLYIKKNKLTANYSGPRIHPSYFEGGYDLIAGNGDSKRGEEFKKYVIDLMNSRDLSVSARNYDYLSKLSGAYIISIIYIKDLKLGETIYKEMRSIQRDIFNV